MPAIRAIKSGNVGDETTDKLVRAADLLVESGAQVVVAGCTEIPLGLHRRRHNLSDHRSGNNSRPRSAPAGCGCPETTLRWSFRAACSREAAEYDIQYCCVSGKPVERARMSDIALERIREAIVTGELAPGSKIKDSELAEYLGLSRTPVREALARLVDTGLVEAKPGAYTRITTLDRGDVEATLAVIEALDQLAVVTAVPNLTDEMIGAMRGRPTRTSLPPSSETT